MTTVTAVTAILEAGAVSKTSSRSSRLSRGAVPTPPQPSEAVAVGRGGARERSEGWPQGRPKWSGLCPDEVQGALFKGRPCWGRQPQLPGAKPPHPLGRAHGTFAPTGRKCHSGLLHFPQEVPPPNPRPFSTTKHLKQEDFCLWREATALTAPTQEI